MFPWVQAIPADDHRHDTVLGIIRLVMLARNCLPHLKMALGTVSRQLSESPRQKARLVYRLKKQQGEEEESQEQN